MNRCGKIGIKSSTDIDMEPFDLERYSRQIALPGWGAEGQKRIADSRVAVVGVGGLGSPVALYLAVAGVGALTLIDNDTVSLSNLQRQILHAEGEVGNLKTASAASRLRAINTELEITLHPVLLSPDNAAGMLSGHDIIVDCTDNYAARYLIDTISKAYRIPWVYGAVAGMQGALSLFGGNSGRQFRDLYPESETLGTVTAGEGAIAGPTPGIVGSMQALETLKYLVGIPTPLDGALFSIDLTTYQTYLLEI